MSPAIFCALIALSLLSIERAFWAFEDALVGEAVRRFNRDARMMLRGAAGTLVVVALILAGVAR